MYCFHFGLFLHLVVLKKLNCSYNSVLRRLLCIRMLYSPSEMFLLMGFHLFMGYSVNVFTIFEIVLEVAETLSLRHTCR